MLNDFVHNDCNCRFVHFLAETQIQNSYLRHAYKMYISKITSNVKKTMLISQIKNLVEILDTNVE